MNPDIVVLGGANYDYLARAKELPGPGDTAEGDLIDEAPGGKGANQAVAAARLGARVAFVGCIGGDERGERVLGALRREGIDVACVRRHASVPTGVALIHVDASGQKQILAVPGANGCFGEDGVRSAAELIRGAKVLLLQLEVPLPSVILAASIAQEAGVQVVLDPAPAIPLPDELLSLVAAIKPNSGEAKVLTGIDVTDRDSAREAARQLLRRGAQAVAVAAGSEGTLALSAHGETWLPRHEVESVDATGAGDAFAAALGVALAEGRPFEQAAAFANAAAALATTITGAQAAMPTRDSVLALQIPTAGPTR